ncbi:uncharacterized protein LOC117180296 [Belonocnema kinseyi]|uniref:uncharacterized protein LOC117180296 n=1 Tax=Belonocnema kinseyi TaxID=2817044 RepID=UPI00143DC4C7|nr:uncharacterized protein LOC117180296 [Belonocnema kinseyi]
MLTLAEMRNKFNNWFAGSNAEKEDIKHILKEYFDIKPEELKEQCDGNDYETRLANAKKAKKILKNATNAILKDGMAHFQPTDADFGPYVGNQCEISEDVQKAKLDMIKAALPCASQERIDQAVKYSLTHTC